MTGDAGAQAPEVELEAPPEPRSLREAMRGHLLDGGDWEDGYGPGLGVGATLWEAWGPQLRAHGMDEAALDAAVRGYRREVWFWVLGDRSWQQIAGGLAGRVARRLPGG